MPSLWLIRWRSRSRSAHVASSQRPAQKTWGSTHQLPEQGLPLSLKPPQVWRLLCASHYTQHSWGHLSLRKNPTCAWTVSLNMQHNSCLSSALSPSPAPAQPGK